jgi:hypothetical protein
MISRTKIHKLYLRHLAAIIVICFGFISIASAKQVKNKHFKIKITIPDQLLKVKETTNSIQGDLYFDTTAGIICMMSGRESRYKSVSDYLDCSRENLEQQLKHNFGDSTLTLVSCRRSAKYSKKIIILHFRVSILPSGFNTYVIYFIHHRNRDIQLSFTCKNKNEQADLAYINSIMQTLKLK